jgi:hypothetical protein
MNNPVFSLRQRHLFDYRSKAAISCLSQYRTQTGRAAERDSTGYLKTNTTETSVTERTDHKLVISQGMYTVYFPVTVPGTHSTALERN